MGKLTMGESGFVLTWLSDASGQPKLGFNQPATGSLVKVTRMVVPLPG